MNTKELHDLRDFHRFIGEKLNGNEALQSPEEILDEWRILHPSPAEIEDDVAAIQEAIDDMDAGDTGIPFEDFDKEFRARRNLPTKS